MLYLVFVSNPFISTLFSFVCWLGCYILTCSTEQFRLLALGHHVSKILTTKGQFALMTLALGGVSLYAMNFLALAGLTLHLPESESVGHEFEPHLANITFKVVPLSVSALVACIMSFLGLYVASKDPMFAKTKKQIVDEFIAGAKGMSLKEVKAISAYKMFWVISTKKLGRLALGGLITGIGATATAGMTIWSIAITDIQLEWSVGAFVGTAIFSIFFSIVSFWVLFRLLSLYPRKEILRLGCCCIMAVGFTLTHYFSMDGVTIRFAPGMAADDSKQTADDGHLEQVVGMYIILVSVIVFCFVMLILAVVDLRSWLYEASNVVHKHETMLLRLKALHTDNFAIIAKYMREVEFERSHHSRSSHITSSNPSSPRSGAAVGRPDLLSNLMPFARDRVAPGSESESVTESGVLPRTPRTPRPHTVAPCSMLSIAETAGEMGGDAAVASAVERAVSASPTALLKEGDIAAGNDPPTYAVSSGCSAKSSGPTSVGGISAKAASMLSIKLPSSESIRLPETTGSRCADPETGLGATAISGTFSQRLVHK